MIKKLKRNIYSVFYYDCYHINHMYVDAVLVW